MVFLHLKVHPWHGHYTQPVYTFDNRNVSNKYLRDKRIKKGVKLPNRSLEWCAKKVASPPVCVCAILVSFMVYLITPHFIATSWASHSIIFIYYIFWRFFFLLLQFYVKRCTNSQKCGHECCRPKYYASSSWWKPHGYTFLKKLDTHSFTVFQPINKGFF